MSQGVAIADAYRAVVVTGAGTNLAQKVGDQLTLTAGSGISLTTNTTTNTVTLTNTNTAIVSPIEAFSSPAISANAVTLNLSTSAVYYLASNGANITANFTNVNTTASQTTTVTLIINQGATAYIPNAITINTVSQTIKWQGNTIPSGNINKIDLVSFTFICTATSTYTVIGSLNTYG
jgi:hypothetical protein